MGKKKRNHPDIEEVLARPWCYYCERDFDDLKILIDHQRAKHFRCERCGKRLNTAGGLSVHMNQVHKETLSSIENALPNRSGHEIEIFGMEGIPEDVVQAHRQRVLTQFAQAEADRRAATGNPGPGGGGAGGNANKKPKLESPSDLKKRLAEHKAKVAAEQETANASSGNATPMEGVVASPVYMQNQGFAGSPPYPQQQALFGPTSGAPTYEPFPQPYGQSNAPFQPPQVSFAPNVPFPQQQAAFGLPAPSYGAQAFSPPPQQYPTPVGTGFAPPGQFHSASSQPQFQGVPPRFGGHSPSVPFGQQGQYQPPRTHTPPQHASSPGTLHQRQNSLPVAPGLPQRPAFGAPPVDKFQMQQLHQGHIPSPPAHQTMPHQQPSTQNGVPSQTQQANGGGIPEAQAKSSNEVDIAQSAAPDASTATPASRPEAAPAEKKGRKNKDKEIRMVYSDNDTSPEEKMARLPKYAFTPNTKPETVLVDAGDAAAVTGVVADEEHGARNIG